MQMAVMQNFLVKWIIFHVLHMSGTLTWDESCFFSWGELQEDCMEYDRLLYLSAFVQVKNPNPKKGTSWSSIASHAE